jgi:hypothetical protein
MGNTNCWTCKKIQKSPPAKIINLIPNIPSNLINEDIEPEFANEIILIAMNERITNDDKRREILKTYATRGIPRLITKLFILEELAKHKIPDILWMQIWTQSPQISFGVVYNRMLEYLVRVGFWPSIIEQILRQCEYNPRFIKRFKNVVESS